MIVDKFLNELAKIKEPEVFLGVARILKVKLVEEDAPRQFEAILMDCVDAFDASSRKRQKELLSILKQANKGGLINGNNSKHSEKAVSDEEMREVRPSNDH